MIERHATLRAAIDWPDDLLDSAEQRSSPASRRLRRPHVEAIEEISAAILSRVMT